MKRKLLATIWSILFGMLVVFYLVACTEDKNIIEEEFGTTIFEVEPITFEGIAGEQEEEIHFIAGAPWTATFTSSNNWVSASPTQGKAGDAYIRITPYSDNKSSTTRSADLMILVDGQDTPFMVRVTQESAAQSDLQITGDVNEGVMTLIADESGNKFIGTLQVKSSSKWEIISNSHSNWLSFSKDKEPQDGNETNVTLTVMADYSQFNQPTMSGDFQLQVPGTTPITIQVIATAECNVFDSETANAIERLEYEMVDTLKVGTYQTLFYVTSNIAWEIKNLPSWLAFANENETATNRKENGTIQTRPVGVGVLVKEEALSAEARSTDLVLSNQRGEILKTIHLEFKGINNNYLQHDFAFPSVDPLGGDFSFEAKASYIDPENEEDYWKKIELPFHIKTSLDYSSIDNAPYHLVMCNAHNGIISREEVHWATLRMGDETSSLNGLYTKEIYLKANDRGDADDQNGITNPANLREAFIFIVPKNIGFNDLFIEGTSLLKEEYAESFSHILQKQDHGINYVLNINGLENGTTLYVPAEGGSFEFDVLDVTTDQLTPELVRLWYNSGTGEWEERAATTAQENSITIGFIRSQETGKLETMVVSVAPDMVTATRGFRFKINAFRGDGYSDMNVLTFDIMLK